MEYTENYLNSMDEALADEVFMEKLRKADSKEQIKKLFRQEKGIEIADDVAQTAIEKANYIRQGGELSAEELELVAGGCRACPAFARAGASIGAQWGRNLWGEFGGMLGAVVGARIAMNIAHMFH